MSTNRQKSPATAAILNFLFWGAGYVYTGRMWGLAILIPGCILTAFACVQMAETGSDMEMSPVELIVQLSIGVALGWHAYMLCVNDRAEE